MLQHSILSSKESFLKQLTPNKLSTFLQYIPKSFIQMKKKSFAFCSNSSIPTILSFNTH